MQDPDHVVADLQGYASERPDALLGQQRVHHGVRSDVQHSSCFAFGHDSTRETFPDPHPRPLPRRGGRADHGYRLEHRPGGVH